MKLNLFRHWLTYSGLFAALLVAGCGTPALSPTPTPSSVPVTPTPVTPTPSTVAAGLPDLVPTGRLVELETEGACLSGTQPPTGLSVFIANNGNADAGAFVVQAGKQRQTVQSLKAGDTVRVFFQGYDTLDTAVIVDPDNQIQELNKANNTLPNEQVPIPTLPELCTPIANSP